MNVGLTIDHCFWIIEYELLFIQSTIGRGLGKFQTIAEKQDLGMSKTRVDIPICTDGAALHPWRLI